MRFSSGDSFGRYSIEALIGEGGMGEVYRASDGKLRRRVALKVLRREAASDSDTWGKAVARMQREARIAAALAHPGLVAVYDVGEHDGTPFIAMELVEGRSLRHLIGKDLPLGRRLRILLDVARALSAAHDKDLVHRDVKPENVMLRDDGVVKVLDFGIARTVRLGVSPTASTVDGASLSTLTGEGAFIGTPAYMAPEQIRGEELDARADQFAWGVLAYELLSGKLPFRVDRGAMSLLASILGDTPPPLADVPEGIAQLVLRALAKDRAERFASMHEVADTLATFVTAEGHVTPAGSGNNSTLGADIRPGRASPPRLMGRRSWARPALAAVAIVAALGGTAALLRTRGREQLAVTTPVASASAGPVPTAITDRPLPASSSPEAQLAYREGMQAIRDAAWETALVAFQRAAERDPSIGAAHLRAALITVASNVSVSREAYRKAVSLRNGLDGRDQGLLDAFEPHIQRDPPDITETVRRLAALSARFPGDAELVFWQAHLPALPADRRLEHAERCLELDPQYADCWQIKGKMLAALERTAEAIPALERCLAVSPGAVDCLMERASIETATGQCAALEETARRSIAKDPSSGNGYALLATALFAEGKPVPTVRAAIEQASKRHRTAVCAMQGEYDEILLAMATGDFTQAERMLHERLDAIDDMPVASLRWKYVDMAILLAQEMGDEAAAASIAERFLARKDVLGNPEAELPFFDDTPSLLAAARRGGRISAEAFEAERAAWLRRWEKNATVQHDPQARLGLWYGGYAFPALTADEARQALAVLPELAPLPHVLGMQKAPPGETALGRVYALAGDPKAALPHLKAAASTCDALQVPILHLWTVAQLGMVHEAMGDKDAACNAYRAVLARWGEARPSVTARDVSRHAKALGCGSSRGS